MKNKFTVVGLLVASSLSVSADTLIAGWDTWAVSPGTTYNAPITNGVTAAAVGTDGGGNGAGWGGWSNSDGRSADGNWGTLALAPLPSTSIANTSDSVGLRNGQNSGELTITLTNTSGFAWDLVSFHFDAITRFTQAPDSWSLSINSGDVTTGLIDSGIIENVSSFGARTATGYDIDLSGLADRTFANGESVVFELAFTGGTDSGSGGQNMMLDNMAIVAVPEPSTFALLGLAGLALLARRRR